MRLPHKYPYSVALLLAIILLIGCGMEDIQSAWCDRQTAIDDAGYVKWENARPPVTIGEISVNVLNDDKTVYMRLATHNPAILARFITGGFTVWFDETGSDRKKYGVRFPLPSSLQSMEERKNAALKDEPKRDMIVNKLRELAQGDIEITRPGENEFSTISAEYSAPYGIRCRLQYAKGTFAYELYMPLVKDKTHPYAVSEKRPKTIGIGLETGLANQQPRFQENRTQRRTAGPLDRMQNDTGPAVIGAQETGKAISQWLKIHLAEK